MKYSMQSIINAYIVVVSHACCYLMTFSVWKVTICNVQPKQNKVNCLLSYLVLSYITDAPFIWWHILQIVQDGYTINHWYSSIWSHAADKACEITLRAQYYIEITEFILSAFLQTVSWGFLSNRQNKRTVNMYTFVLTTGAKSLWNSL